MSELPKASPDKAASQALPAWISAGAIGLVVGAGLGILGMQGLHSPAASGKVDMSATPATPPMGMGGGGMGMGMGGGGGGGGGKRALTSLVGKLELLSRPGLNLHVELDDAQSQAIATKLTELEKSESMSNDEAQKAQEDLEAILTSEQKDALAAISLPFGRGGRGGGGGGGQPGGAPMAHNPSSPAATGTPAAPATTTVPTSTGGGAPAMGMGGGGMMGMGGGNSNPNENPFTQEANQKRLHDLLSRLGSAPVKSDDVTKPE